MGGEFLLYLRNDYFTSLSLRRADVYWDATLN